MKAILTFLLTTLFASSVLAGTKIQFHSLIEQGHKQRESLSRNVEALMEGAEHNEEEKEVLDFVANEIDLEAKSKLANQKKADDKKNY